VESRRLPHDGGWDCAGPEGLALRTFECRNCEHSFPNIVANDPMNAVFVCRARLGKGRVAPAVSLTRAKRTSPAVAPAARNEPRGTPKRARMNTGNMELQCLTSSRFVSICRVVDTWPNGWALCFAADWPARFRPFSKNRSTATKAPIRRRLDLTYPVKRGDIFAQDSCAVL